MPPRRRTERQTNTTAPQVVDPSVVAKRKKRQLDELERSNYVESSASLFAQRADGEAEFGGTAKDRAAARSTISTSKKKSTMAVRSALLYRKPLTHLIEESGIANLPRSTPTYLTAVAAPSREPARLICSVCGYWGHYKCRRCAFPYCDMKCQTVHDETRCEKRVI
ncbi:hypothetical protein SISNIDRAFT_486528 [Sistotremastrum niveocremeum HHB9708]|uniref:HIT-type domain-containing protein n=2 Tax=Sistotremastraceae TaxID=3402574 RepID=A0A164TMV3_9AGAM|nr:hypothetical protein SISNIDRAFT_486528 [Sistotremastrum niveocremeum HHB9708]KZT42167.1 hypothetical protein SISSUDRAFT_1069501 [Sistotremastrum suecicum HHB10207 ss-3]